MAKEDFKNAAAKLLAQHSKQMKKSSEPVAAVRSQVQSPAVSPPTRRPVTTVILHEPDTEHELYSPEPQNQNHTKLYILVGLALLSCAIMVLLVPETIFGLVGNAVVGLVFGTGLGWLISKEL